MVWRSDQPCRFYMIDGSCKYGSDCWFSHGLDSFGRIEIQIRVLLHLMHRFPVPVVNLPRNCSELHIKLLQDGQDGNPDHLLSLLWRLHTIYLFHDSIQWYVILLEVAPPAYNPNVMDFNSETRIYITVSAQSREICTESKVRSHFSHFGPVVSVTIPHGRSYGFVRFLLPGTVRLLLSNWNPEVPHFISGARLHVDRYIPYYLWNPAENHGPNGLDGGPGHVPNALGGVPGQEPGAPDGNAAQQDMNPAGNHGLNGPGGGLGHVPNAPVAVPDDVLDVLDGDGAEQDMNPGGNGVAGQVPGVPDELPGVPDGGAGQQDMDEIVAALPDVDCFCKEV
ncbi:putative zinc finger CCCH domain-containing protein 51 [Triticum aestivum]|uniref:putative zinc finger CCCH domain-containing protein 51 n=1 Tax=Triticum aestivum TaxID=4565 RepID=UPI001D031CC6|nr:putative zinc finger CCCH domain-containing protein 51 [Triticum aestivum]